MPRMIFVNLPVADVAAATGIYRAMGFELNPMFSNADTSCMVWSDAINVMLLAHHRYRDFTAKAIADTAHESAALLCLSCADRAEVDRIAANAHAAGATELHGAEDHGFMYSRALEDRDGHAWQLMWLDVDAMRETMAKAAG